MIFEMDMGSMCGDQLWLAFAIGKRTGSDIGDTHLCRFCQFQGGAENKGNSVIETFFCGSFDEL